MSVFPEITIGVDGDKQVSRRLQVAADVLGALTPLWDEVVHPWFIDHMEQQFATAGKHGGEPWAGYDSEPHYEGYKLGIVGHLEPLRWEAGYERLAPSLMDATHPDHVYRRGGRSMRAGTRVPYARDINEGGTNLFGEPQPARRIIAIKRSQRRGLMREIARWMQGEMQGARIVREKS